MASDVVFAGDFDITFKFWTRTANDEMILGNNAVNTDFIGCLAGATFRVRFGGVTINSAAGLIEKARYYIGRVTRVGTTVTLYLDGVSVGSGTNSNTLTLNSIGSYNAGALTFNGYIADIDLGTYAWNLDEATASTEASTPAGNTITYTNIPTTERFTFTESSGAEYWWGTNGDNLELDVQQPAADAYAILGQSNAIGRANIVPGIDDVYSTLNGRVMSFGFDSQTRYGAQNPLDHADEVAGDMGFWRTMCLELSASNLLMLPCGDGGTSFFNGDWPQGGAAYNAAVASINAGMLSNSANSLKGVELILGETDAENNVTEAAMLAYLQAMRTAMITDVTDMTADTPWIVVEILAAVGTWTQINSALALFVDSIPNGTLITNDGLALEDVYHYNNPSINSIGTQVGTAAEAFLPSEITEITLLKNILNPLLQSTLKNPFD